MKSNQKGNLLDTGVALIAADGPNFLSVVAWWEVMLKSMKAIWTQAIRARGGLTPWTSLPQRRFRCDRNMLRQSTVSSQSITIRLIGL